VIKALRTLMTCLIVTLMGCAAPMPIPFNLLDPESRIQRGTIFPADQRIEVTVDGQTFSGFYILATGEAFSQTTSGRRSFPSNTETTYYTNSARAHLTSDKGQQLSCKFLIESKRAVGECRSPAGAVFQLFSD